MRFIRHVVVVNLQAPVLAALQMEANYPVEVEHVKGQFLTEPVFINKAYRKAKELAVIQAQQAAENKNQ